MVEALIFYLFASVLVISAFMVITARNPVHSVLFLILAFFNAAGLFIMLGAEFVGMILVIVYVGAVAVLFLFVVMMLDINFSDLRKGAMQYVPLGLFIGGVLLAELTIAYGAWKLTPALQSNLSDPVIKFNGAQNTESLGQILYTDYVLPFQMSGLVLFVAMVGAIVLTLRTRPDVKRQKVAEQVHRRKEDVLEIHKISPRTGV